MHCTPCMDSAIAAASAQWYSQSKGFIRHCALQLSRLVDFENFTQLISNSDILTTGAELTEGDVVCFKN